MGDINTVANRLYSAGDRARMEPYILMRFAAVAEQRSLPATSWIEVLRYSYKGSPEGVLYGCWYTPLLEPFARGAGVALPAKRTLRFLSKADAKIWSGQSGVAGRKLRNGTHCDYHWDSVPRCVARPPLAATPRAPWAPPVEPPGLSFARFRYASDSTRAELLARGRGRLRRARSSRVPRATHPFRSSCCVVATSTSSHASLHPTPTRIDGGPCCSASSTLATTRSPPALARQDTSRSSCTRGRRHGQSWCWRRPSARGPGRSTLWLFALRPRRSCAPAGERIADAHAPAQQLKGALGGTQMPALVAVWCDATTIVLPERIAQSRCSTVATFSCVRRDARDKQPSVLVWREDKR